MKVDRTKVRVFTRSTEGAPLLSPYPCANCGTDVRHMVDTMSVDDRPVVHSMNLARCPACKAEYLIFSCMRLADCDALAPLAYEALMVFRGEPA